MPFLIFRHIDANHVFLVIEHELGQRAGQLGFADSGGTEKNKRADGPVRIFEAGAGANHRVGDGVHGLVLADDALVQMIGEPQQFFFFAFEQSRNRNAGPARHHRRNIVLVDFLLEQARAALVVDALFLFGQLAFQLGQLAVFELGGAIEIVLALRLLDRPPSLFRSPL